MMPILDAVAPLPVRPRRVLVAGTSGAGKTTLASRVAVLLDIPHIEIDALFHGPGWTPQDSFESEVHKFSAGPSWVTEWQYTQVRAILAQRADLLVWLNLPRALVMRQVIGRTVRRRWARQVLWNGNCEPPLWTILTDREHIVRWAWSTHHKTAMRVAALLEKHPDLVIVRLTSRNDVERWLAGPLQTTGHTSRQPEVVRKGIREWRRSVTRDVVGHRGRAAKARDTSSRPSRPRD